MESINLFNGNITKTTITVLLMLTIAVSMVALQPIDTAQAAEYLNPADIAVEPNPVGIGQSVLVTFFLVNPTPNAVAGFNPDKNWNNFKLTITTPSGKTQTYGPYTSDASGGNYMSYIPEEVGNYTFFFSFPGQTIGSDYYKPANATTTLTVQEEPIKEYQTPAIPTEYWTRPIYGENRGWYTIGGNWLRGFYNNTVKFNPYTTAPNTAHIVWTKQQYMAGIVGGANFDESGNALTYYQGPIYQNYFVPPLIISGRLYYMERDVAGNGFTGLHCVDIRTGKQLWFQDVSVIGATTSLYGQIFNANGANGAGTEAFIWSITGVNWTVFDANTGRQLYTVTNVTQGTGTVSGPQLLNCEVDSMGSIIAYYIDGTNNWLLKWNSTLMLSAYAGNLAMNIYSPPVGQTIDWKKGIEWNVTITPRDGILSFGLTGSPGSNNGITYTDGNVLFAATASINTPVNNFTMVAYSCETGRELWYSNFTDVFTPGSTNFEFLAHSMMA